VLIFPFFSVVVGIVLEALFGFFYLNLVRSEGEMSKIKYECRKFPIGSKFSRSHRKSWGDPFTPTSSFTPTTIIPEVGSGGSIM
jgi:hypothetical protein